MPPVTLAPRLNTIAAIDSLVAFCTAHASLAPFLACETELPTGRTIHTPNPAGGGPIRSIVWKKNLRVVKGPRMAAWCEQEAPILVWDELSEAVGDLPSQRHRQRATFTVRGLLVALGATAADADDRVLQMNDTIRDIFLGSGAYIGTVPTQSRILDAKWAGSFWDPVPRGNPLISARVINLEIGMGE